MVGLCNRVQLPQLCNDQNWVDFCRKVVTMMQKMPRDSTQAGRILVLKTSRNIFASLFFILFYFFFFFYEYVLDIDNIYIYINMNIYTRLILLVATLVVELFMFFHYIDLHINAQQVCRENCKLGRIVCI